MDRSEQILLVALLGGVIITTAGFLIGRRTNRSLAIAVSREIEAALAPSESTYTWIGGLIGFHARYEVAGYEQVKVTCTLLPRQSPFYMPLALLLGRGDRVHLTFYLDGGFHDEGHIISSAADRSPLIRIEGRETMSCTSTRKGSSGYVLLGTSDETVTAMDELLTRIDQRKIAESVRHVAVVADLHTLYVQVVPAPGVVREICELAVESKEWIGERF